MCLGPIRRCWVLVVGLLDPRRVFKVVVRVVGRVNVMVLPFLGCFTAVWAFILFLDAGSVLIAIKYIIVSRKKDKRDKKHTCILSPHPSVSWGAPISLYLRLLLLLMLLLMCQWLVVTYTLSPNLSLGLPPLRQLLLFVVLFLMLLLLPPTFVS